MGNVLHMEEIVIPKYSLLVRLGFLQHAGAVWKSDHALRYKTYFILEWTDLRSSVAFMYGTSFERMDGFLEPDAGMGGHSKEEDN